MTTSTTATTEGNTAAAHQAPVIRIVDAVVDEGTCAQRIADIEARGPTFAPFTDEPEHNSSAAGQQFEPARRCLFMGVWPHGVARAAWDLAANARSRYGHSRGG